VTATTRGFRCSKPSFIYLAAVPSIKPINATHPLSFEDVLHFFEPNCAKSSFYVPKIERMTYPVIRRPLAKFIRRFSLIYYPKQPIGKKD